MTHKPKQQTSIERICSEVVKSKGYNLEIIRPKERFDINMNLLIEQFYQVALDSFAKHLPFEAISSRTAHSDLILVIKDPNNKIVGYSVNDIINVDEQTKANIFSTALFRREIQGKRLYPTINKLRVYLLPQANALVTRTQNPIVFRKFSNLAKEHNYEIYPNDQKPTPKIIQIAKAYDPNVTENLISKGVYFGRSLMDDTPEPKTETEKQIWSKLDINQGDGVVIVGYKN
jgi:hypothetical protein